MKRNEAIKIATVFFENNYSKDVWNSFSIERQLKHVLDFFEEEIGILPPLNKNIAQGDDEAIRGLKWE